MSNIEVRPLAEAERAQWEPLWRSYLDFYETTLPPKIYDLTWRRLQDPLVPMHGLGAHAGGKLVGIVHYLFHASTWTEGPYCYLQDLFTVGDLRGKGVGRALIEAVYARAQDAGASRVYWLTQEKNATARLLYDRIAHLSGFIQYRKVL